MWCHCSTFFSSFFSNRFFIAFSPVFRAFLASFSAPETPRKAARDGAPLQRASGEVFAVVSAPRRARHFRKSRALVYTGARFLRFRPVVFWRAFSTLYLSKLVQKSIENRSKSDKNWLKFWWKIVSKLKLFFDALF